MPQISGNSSNVILNISGISISPLDFGNSGTTILTAMAEKSNFIYAGGYTTSDNFITTTYEPHYGAEGAINPLAMKVKREDLSVLCFPSLPVAPTTSGVLPLYPVYSTGSEVRWPGFLLTWSDAYCGFTNSFYIVSFPTVFFGSPLYVIFVAGRHCHLS